MNPYLFIVGCPRSGTTLLRRLVDAHPDVAIVDETRWIASFFERRKGLTPEGLVTPALISELLGYDRFAGMEISRDELEPLISDNEPVPYSRFVTGIFDLYGQKRGKRLVGDKTPRYARRVPTLHALWPKAKFVHLIRDGRSVCLSVLSWKKSSRALGRFASWRAEPTATVALWWELHLRLCREVGERLGPDLYHEVRYEALVSDPARECERICDFLNIPYDDAMLHFHKGRRKEDPDLDAKKAWRPVTPGLRDWKTQMPRDDVRRFEAVAGDLLQELDYPLVSDFEPVMLEQALRTRDSFTGDLLSRDHALPEHW